MRYSIGLQSGATDGAVSWGVLERLLEDPQVELEAISGASSGSVNTILCAYGLALGGREKARECLEQFWRLASERGGMQFTLWSPMEAMFGRGSLGYMPQFWMNSAFVQGTSPYLWNPIGFNIVRDVMRSVVDFDVLRRASPLRVFVSATDVRKGEARIFRNHELSLDVAAASTCLPLYIPAQEIDGSEYWDGGLIGAPKLQPLVEECEASDIILIRISPVERPKVPRTSFGIIERTIELTVAAGLDEELKRINMISHLIEEGRLTPGPDARHMRVHVIEGTSLTRDLPFSGKYNLDWQFLTELRDFGRKLASNWLERAPHANPGKATARAGTQKAA
jgi:NTE family protein